MSYQLLYTSAKRGLEPGKSGFCCVARDRDIPPDLAFELERLSRFEAPRQGLSPRVLRHRIVELRSGIYHVLSRLQDAGVDYSRRNNHIAHHLVFTPAEVSLLPNPAAILLHWTAWREDWSEPPRVLEIGEAFSLHQLDAGSANGSVRPAFPPAEQGGRPLSRAFALEPGEEIFLACHYRDALNALPAPDQWLYAFTNFILPTEQPADFVWTATWDGYPLPFELDFAPRAQFPPTARRRPLAVTLQEAESSDPPQSFGRAAAEAGSAPGNSKRGPAPKVEIPVEYDRAAWKRQLAERTGGKRASRWINLLLFACGVLSVATAYFWMQARREAESGFPSLTYPLSPPASAKPELSAGETWADFTRKAYPRARLPDAFHAAAVLAERGDPLPKEAATFLVSITSDAPPLWPALRSVPGELLRARADGVGLAPSAAEYPEFQTLGLLPKALAEDLIALGEVETPRAALATFGRARFSPGETAQALRVYEAQVRERSSAIGQEKRTAMERFDASRRALETDARFRPLLEIQSAFDLPDIAAFVAIDANGRALANTSRFYGTFLKELFADYALARHDQLENPTAFNEAFRRLAAVADNDALAVSKAVRAAILAAEPKRAFLGEWTVAKVAWEEAFLREDLMQEALLDYTIEALESTKASLLEAQKSFTPAELKEWQEGVALGERARQAIKRALSASADEEWVVFDALSSHF